MKRGGPLKRSAPLPRGKGLLSGTGLSRKARAPRRSPLVWRPKPKTDAEETARRLVLARADGGRCELGIVCSGAALGVDFSHRVGRGVGGPWDAANAGWACRGCHGHLHAWPAEARARTGWMLKSTDDFLTFPVHHAVHGWVVLTSDGGHRPTTERPETA